MARGSYRSTDRYAPRWAPYVSVAARRREANEEIAALRKKGRSIVPIVIEGRRIATSFWGKAWCDHLETYSDYANRLPRGRTYVRNGSVVHLEVTEGTIDALVRGSSMYTVKIGIAALAKARWNAVVADCSGKIASLVALLEGKLSSSVMEVVTHRERGLFPSPREITLSCSCPDWATMCKHVAAVMYGVGARLDTQPELLFRLRGLDAAALFAKAAVGRAARGPRAKEKALAPGSLGSVFGIDIDEGAMPPPAKRKRATRGQETASPREQPARRRRA